MHGLTTLRRLNNYVDRKAPLECIRIPESPVGSAARYEHWSKTIYYDNPLTLAHELAHAIEIKLQKRTTEFTSWQKAYSFLKPQFWNQEKANYYYQSYANRTYRVYLYKESECRVVFIRSPQRFPLTLNFQPVVSPTRFNCPTFYQLSLPLDFDGAKR